MDVRIESNIGLDIMQIDCVQNLLFKLNYTYPHASLLQMKVTPNEENMTETAVSIMLFNEGEIERVWGEDRDVHKLLTRLLSNLVARKNAVDIKELPPIRAFQSPFQQAV